MGLKEEILKIIEVAFIKLKEEVKKREPKFQPELFITSYDWNINNWESKEHIFLSIQFPLSFHIGDIQIEVGGIFYDPDFDLKIKYGFYDQSDNNTAIMGTIYEENVLKITTANKGNELDKLSKYIVSKADDIVNKTHPG